MGAAVAGLSLGSAGFAVAIFSAIWFVARRHRYGRGDRRSLIPLVENHPDSPPVAGDKRFSQTFVLHLSEFTCTFSGFDNVLLDPISS